MVTVGDVERFLATFSPAGVLGEEEGVLFGGRGSEVCGICVSWMATCDAIQYAVRRHCNLIVCHEALTWYDYPVWCAHAAVKTPWPTDERRLELLERHQVAILRAHSTVDPTHVGPALWDALGLPPPVWSANAHSVHRIEAATVGGVVARVKEVLGTGPLRVTGDPARPVATLGIAWGGLGLDRHMDKWITHLFPWGVDAILVGETSDFAQQFARECGVALIEAGHSATEDPGMRRLARDLADAFPGVAVLHRPQEVPWAVV